MREQGLKLRSFVCWVLLSVLLVHCAEAVTFYVSPQGNDRWSGRLAQPNKNIKPRRQRNEKMPD